MARRTARTPAPRRRPPVAVHPEASRRWPRWATAVLAALGLALAGAAVLALRAPESGEGLRRRAMEAADRSRWEEALGHWRAARSKGTVDARSLRAEARACLALGRAGQAEQLLAEASRLDPREPDAWLTRLEIARLEGRVRDALRLGEAAWEAIDPAGRPELAKAWTLAVLADAPEGLARETLARWVDADPGDADALAALDRRRSEGPIEGDPPWSQRVADLERMLGEQADHAGLREALVLTLVEGGDTSRGEKVLAAWPSGEPDARRERLEGRWDLEFRGDACAAVGRFRAALDELPHDWKTRYRLARALQACGQAEAARAEAVRMSRLREALDPARLGPRLERDLKQVDDPAARARLAALCETVGLESLARAWRSEWRDGTPIGVSRGPGA